MGEFFNQVFVLLTVPPGNIVYHLVLAFSLGGALQAALHRWRTNRFPQARRTVVGTGLLLGMQVVLFLVGALASRGGAGLVAALPPLDRLVSFLSLVWIVWIWAFPEPARGVDIATLGATLLGVVFFALTLIFNPTGRIGGFNHSMAEIIWQGFSLAVALAGSLALIIRKPNGWGNGLAMLLLAGTGHLISLVWRMDGDFPGVLRVAHLAMFPILLTVEQRFTASTPQERRKIVPVDEKDQGLAWEERRRVSTDPKTFQSLIHLAAVNSSTDICQNLTRGIAQAMLADLCFLVTIGSDKVLTITCGYDLIREESLGGTELKESALPLLANAIQRGRPLRLPASSTSADLKALGKALGLTNPGHLMEVPIISPERGPAGSVLLLSPYSNRQWNADDEAYMTGVAELLLPILERGERISALELERDSARLDAQTAQAEAVEARRRLEEEPGQAVVSPDSDQKLEEQAASLAALQATHDEAQRSIATLKTEIEQLQAENEKIRASGTAAAPRDNQVLEAELRQTLEEMARMQNALAESNKKIMELESRPATPITTEQVEVIASISQDLRQPMSSIVGYTDLLLGESVGILGALQRKFVERVKTSTERIGTLLDDLIQITNLDANQMEFKPVAIDLNHIIDSAMAYTSTQIREKNITLRLDIPDTPPQVMTDRDALQQVLIHLLQNATAVSQHEGNITLRVQMKEEEGKNYLAIQVTDSGGGIAAEDLPRVFARRYRAEHSLIKGVGDTGVGLSIAKTLAEAQGGRIWVDTQADVGSTYSVLLPVEPVEAEA